MSKTKRTHTEAMKQVMEYRAIDGNWILRPIGWCQYHHGYLSEKQMKTHKCMSRHGGVCGRFQTMEGEYLRKMKSEQFYDRAIDRLTKMEATLNRISKSLEAISKSIDTKGSRIILDNTLARLKPENTSSNIDMSDENA